MRGKPKATPGWWQTFPGILTGIAAIITAVAGLIIAFNTFIHTGSPGEVPKSTSVSGNVGLQPSLPTPAKSPQSTAGSGSAAAVPVALPEINRIKLAGGAAVVTILSAEMEPIDTQRRSLKFAIRYLNAGRYPSNFGSSSYRLIVDDLATAPTNSLNEVVPVDSAKDGEVIFDLPAGTKDVVLQISAGDEKRRIPFKLP